MNLNYLFKLTNGYRYFTVILLTSISSAILADHHIDCNDPLNANHSECIGIIDCSDPINLIYPQCQGSTSSSPTLLPPNALFNMTPDNGEAPLIVTLNASASGDSDGHISRYSWTSSDNQNADGQIVNMNFSASGNYTITLTVTDNQGLTDSISKTLTVSPVDSEEECFAIYRNIDTQLTLNWVDLIRADRIVAQFSDVRMQLEMIENNMNFHVISAQSDDSKNQPKIPDCIAIYKEDSGLLTIPVVNTEEGSRYKNARLKLLEAEHLIFNLDSIDQSDME